MDGSEEHAMDAASFLVKCLENEGVQYIFGIPGEENLEIMNALERSSIRFITTRHEQGAAFMADVYGRLTGKAGVCLSTLGPGATNLVTGVADADSDGAPLIAITGQVGTGRMHLTSHQYLDLSQMFAPITKRTKQIVQADSVGEIVRIAFKYAESEKPGACHIDLPVDVAQQTVTPGLVPLKKQAVPDELAPEASIEAAARLIRGAKEPVVLAGSGAVRAHAAGAITAFAEALNIPVVHTMMAKGVIPYTSPCSMWCVGLPQRDYANLVLDRADLVICVGYDLVEYGPSKWNADPDRRILHIDTRPAHINKLYQPEMEVVGDIGQSLTRIRARTRREAKPEYAQRLKGLMQAEYTAYEGDGSFPVKPQKILSDVRAALGEDDILLSDVGAHKMWIARHYHCYRPNTCIISNGFAAMGIALPGALAAKLVYPERKVLAVTGDGGFLMNCQELETAVRLRLAFVVLIFHDDSYGLIKWKQDDRYGRHRYVDFGDPDFVKFAESFGAKGYRITRTEELAPVLREALDQDVPAIIDCPVDYRENEKLTRHLSDLCQTLE